MNPEQFSKDSEEASNPWEIPQQTENKTGVEAPIEEYPPIEIPKDLHEDGINREESEDTEQDTEPEGELSEMGKECDMKLFEILNNNAENEDYKKKVRKYIADAKERLKNIKDEELTTEAVDNVMKEMMERIKGIEDIEEARKRRNGAEGMLEYYERLFSETTKQPPMPSENSQNKATVNFLD